MLSAATSRTRAPPRRRPRTCRMISPKRCVHSASTLGGVAPRLERELFGELLHVLRAGLRTPVVDPDANIGCGDRRHALQRWIHGPDGRPRQLADARNLERTFTAVAEPRQDRPRQITTVLADGCLHDRVDPRSITALPSPPALELWADDKEPRHERRALLRMPRRGTVFEYRRE